MGKTDQDGQELARLTVHIITEYYKNNKQPCLDVMTDDVLWLGPRMGQKVSGKSNVEKLFLETTTDLRFALGPIEVHKIHLGSNAWDILLSYPVTTIFPSGVTHVHQQRAQESWSIFRSRDKDGTIRPIYQLKMINVSNSLPMETLGLYASSTDDSAIDAAMIDSHPRLSAFCIFHAMDGADYYLPSDRVLYIESDQGGRHSLVHTDQQVLACKDKVSSIFERYPGYFLRAHSSFLVNPIHVISLVRFSLTMKDGATIPIPEKKYTDFKRQLKELMEKQPLST